MTNEQRDNSTREDTTVELTPSSEGEPNRKHVKILFSLLGFSFVRMSMT